MVQVEMTPEVFAAKLQDLQANGVVVTDGGDRGAVKSGTAQRDGVTVAFSYDSIAGQMTCNVTKKPRFVPMGVAESRLKGWLTS